MIKAIEYGILADETTENTDIYAYYTTMENFQNNHDTISVAVTYDGSYLVEITDFDNNVLYSTYAEDGIEVNDEQGRRFLITQQKHRGEAVNPRPP